MPRTPCHAAAAAPSDDESRARVERVVPPTAAAPTPAQPRAPPPAPRGPTAAAPRRRLERRPRADRVRARARVRAAAQRAGHAQVGVQRQPDGWQRDVAARAHRRRSPTSATRSSSTGPGRPASRTRWAARTPTRSTRDRRPRRRRPRPSRPRRRRRSPRRRPAAPKPPAKAAFTPEEEAAPLGRGRLARHHAGLLDRPGGGRQPGDRVGRRRRRPRRDRPHAPRRLQLVQRAHDPGQGAAAERRRAQLRRQRRPRLHDRAPRRVSIDAFASPVWRRSTGDASAAVMDIVNRAGGVVVWIGLPMTRSDDRRRRRFDVDQRGRPARRRSERPGKVVFIDTYTMFAGDDGGFAEYLAERPGRLGQGARRRRRPLRARGRRHDRARGAEGS